MKRNARHRGSAGFQ